MFGLFHQNEFLGIDIGTTSIKVAELKKTNGKLELADYGILEKYGHLERINDAIQTSSLKLLEESTAMLLEKLLDKVKPKTKRSYMALPSFSSFVSLINLPQMPDKEIKKAIKYQAGQYIPMPLKEVTLDWYVVDKNKGRIKILLVAIPTDTIRRYIKTANLAKLDIKEMELETVAVANLFGKKEKSPVALVDIGGRTTSISIMDKGSLRLSYNIDTAGGDLTQVIASGMGVNPLRAEKFKRAYGLSIQNRGEINIRRLLIPLLDVIKREVEKAINNYYLHSKEIVKKVILTGGGSCLQGIEEYYSNTLGMPVVRMDPFNQGLVSYDPRLAPIIKEIGPTLTTACAVIVHS